MARTIPAEQQAVWARMVAEGHPWVGLVKSQAVKDGTTSTRYASSGRWSALHYVMTGDGASAARCYATVATETTNFTVPMKAGNATREHAIERVLMLDWVGETLTAEQARLWRDYLIATAGGCIAATLRIVDSDQVCGTYGFFALLDTLCGTDFLTRSIANGQGGSKIPVGGLDATASDRTTYRNAIKQYLDTMGSGGQWIESWEYNLGTPCLLYMMWVGLKTALGEDHFPEYAAWLPQARIYHRHELIPGLKKAFQWGDVQDTHGMHWVNRDTTYAYLRSGDAVFDQFACEVDVAAARTAMPNTQTPLYPRWFYYANPYAPLAPWVPETELSLVTAGTGHAYWRTGWDTPDRATHLHGPVFSPEQFVDHRPNQFGAVQHARDGRFLLDQPQGYGASITAGNVLLVCYSAPSYEAGAVTASAFQPGVIAYAACTNAGMGPDIARKYYLPPPTYLHEYTRAVVELLDGPESILVIADRVHTDDPRVQTQANGKPALDRYPAAAQTRMKSARGLIDLLWHTPVAPTVTEGGFSWLVPNTTWHVEVWQVLPFAPFAYEVVDETVEIPGNVPVTERKWCVHAVAPEPATLPTFQTMLQVLVASEGTAAVTATALVRAPSPTEPPDVRGVLLSRPDRIDVAVLFSARPGPIVTYSEADLGIVTTARLLTETFSVTLPRPATVYVADLDPAVSWQATIAGAHAPIAVVGDLVSVVCEAAGALKLWANEDPPLVRPIVPEWRITEQTATRIVLER